MLLPVVVGLVVVGIVVVEGSIVVVTRRVVGVLGILTQ